MKISRSIAVVFVTLQSVILLTKAWKEECAVDERRLKLKFDSKGKTKGNILVSRDDIHTVDDCYKACCDLRKDKDETSLCNAASFFRQDDGTDRCLNINCQPFSECEWESTMGGLSAKVALFNDTVDFEGSDEDETSQSSESSETDQSSANSTSSVNGTSAATNETSAEELADALEEEAKDEEEEDEALDQLFNNGSVEDEWNVDYSETSTSMFNDMFSTTPSPTANENEEGEGEGETIDEGNTDQFRPPPPVRPNTHGGNSGIYGPNEVNDFDYATTPLIVIGAIVTVLFMLIVLICVGRKLSASERLKYRPLRDSFPANNANSYHDID